MRKLIERHHDDGFGLRLGKSEFFLDIGLGVGFIVAGFDDFHDFIENADGFDKTFNDLETQSVLI